jgi:predicted TIM-barrel fold metal-dependent hydrolase
MARKSGGYVDADGHVRDGEEQLRPYLAAPFNRRNQLLPDPPDGYDNTLGGTLGGKDVNAELWLDALDQAGMETTVLYGGRGLFVGWVRDTDYAIALCRAFNDYLHHEYLKVSPRFQGVALLPLQDPAAAARELRRAVKQLHMVGGILPADGPWLLGKPTLDPVYQEAQRLGCMLAIHGSGRLWGGVDQFLFDRYIQVHTLGHPISQMKQLTSVVLEGVPERFPGLRLACLEAGSGWVPFMMDRMDEKHHLRGKVEAPLLTKKPSDYVRSGAIYFTCEAGESILPEVLRVVGEDVFMFASDFPHWDSDFPHNLYELLERRDLTKVQKAKLTRENARALYGLG